MQKAQKHFGKDYEMKYKNALEIDVGRCINTLLRKWRFVTIITAFFLAAGFGLTLNKGVDAYTATATVYAAADGSYSDATTAVTAMNAYLSVAGSYKVCQRAALIMGRDDIDPSYIQGAISVYSSANRSTSTTSSFIISSATIISFSATTTDPELSMTMADAMAQSYSLEMAEILNKNSVKLLDSAHSARVSYNAVKHAWKVRLLAIAVGFVLACAFVVGFEIFDPKIRTVRDASVRNSIPVLGIIPDYKND